MLILKLEQNLFEEIKLLPAVKEEKKEDSVFFIMDVDFFEGVSKVTVEKKKYPYFYKYYLYFNENMTEAVSLRSEEGIKFLLAFYNEYHPEYVKKSFYDAQIGINVEEYFYMDLVPGESMQHFVPGKGSVEEVLGPQKKDVQGYRGLEGYHEFSSEEKKQVGLQLDALKDQFADQLKELEALMGKKVD